jgi:hypothetical protein
MWIDPGVAEQFLVLSGLPAFLAGVPLIKTLGRRGISEVTTLFAVLPPLLGLWYFFLGWLLELGLRKFSAAKTSHVAASDPP